MAHESTYIDGKPQGNPKRCARTPGTTVTVNDLFYNVPHRKKALRDEYPKILALLQPYAVQVARKGVGIIVQQQQAKKKTVMDLNTTHLSKVQAVGKENKDRFLSDLQKEAIKQVISTIYGSFWQQHLLYFQSESNSTDTDDSSPPQKMNYTCDGFLAAPSLASIQLSSPLKQPAFLLFVNDRQVECPPLKRQLEEIYAALTPWKKPPFLYLSLQVPARQVDVNVHPSKTQVALLFLEDIVSDIAGKVQSLLEQQDKTFGDKQKRIVENPYRKKPSKKESTTTQEEPEKDDSHKKRKRSDNNINNNNNKNSESSQSTQRRKSSLSDNNSSNSTTQSSSQLVRTHKATPVGALEPFLVRKPTTSTPSTQSSSTTTTTASKPQTPTTIHKPTCPLATPLTPMIDLNKPGAFAELAQQCNCREEEMEQKLRASTVLLPTQTRVIRPASVVPTDCPLASIRTLRRRVQKQLDIELQQKLRQAYFVGVLSEHRSLIQYQEELCMIHHTRLTKALFYQLALAHFGGNRVAKLGTPIHIQTLMEQWLQIEEDLQEEGGLDSTQGETSGVVKVSKTNVMLAKQAAACLGEKSAMLEEYFGIVIQHPEGETDEQKIVLTGLPILLDGHSPPPHGLPLFLLRLATEVDWEEERPCFDGVCRELGNYYAQLDGGDGQDEETRKAQVQHTLFPALSCLLMPSEQLKGDVKPLTLLSNLYKVFERC